MKFLFYIHTLALIWMRTKCKPDTIFPQHLRHEATIFQLPALLLINLMEIWFGIFCAAVSFCMKVSSKILPNLCSSDISTQCAFGEWGSGPNLSSLRTKSTWTHSVLHVVSVLFLKFRLRASQSLYINPLLFLIFLSRFSLFSLKDSYYIFKFLVSMFLIFKNSYSFSAYFYYKLCHRKNTLPSLK